MLQILATFNNGNSKSVNPQGKFILWKACQAYMRSCNNAPIALILWLYLLYVGTVSACS